MGKKGKKQVDIIGALARAAAARYPGDPSRPVIAVRFDGKSFIAVVDRFLGARSRGRFSQFSTGGHASGTAAIEELGRDWLSDCDAVEEKFAVVPEPARR
jgi:hypothetical protein